jgi:ABC-type antimicrobial peptide transport system permease subunit
VDQVTLAEAAPFADMIAKPNARFSAPHRSGRVQLGAVRQRIGANYFATLGVPLVRGREFTAQDVRNGATPGAPQPVLVNQTGARELFGEQEALGQRLQDATTGASYFIVGITRDLRAGFFSSTPVPTVFTPLTSDPHNSAATDPLAALSKGSFGAAPGATIVVRSAPGVDAAAVVRTQLTAIDPSLTVFNSRTMTDQLEQMNGLIQMGTILYSGIGVFGLLLASIGLAGITSYAVARRTREIGIRTALGARPGQILRLVMREGAALVAVGTVVGFAGAMVIARVLSSMAAELAQAFGASTGDPVLLAGAPLLLAGVTLLACYLPARRAAKINPLEALRQE